MGKSPVKAHLGEAQKVNLVSGHWNFLVELTKGRSLLRAAWRNCCRFACPVGLCRGANGWGRKDFRAAELWELERSVMACICSNRTWEAEAGEWPWAPQCPASHGEFLLNPDPTEWDLISKENSHETYALQNYAILKFLFFIHYYSHYYCMCV